MDGKTDRTFRIVADGNYEKWGKELPSEIKRPDQLNVYADPVEISDGAANMQAMQFISKYEIAEGEEYIRLHGWGLDAKYAEGYTTVYKQDDVPTESGQYLAVMYRIPEDNPEKIGRFEFFLSTETTNLGSANTVMARGVKNDGLWNVIIIDLEQASNEFKAGFVKADDGKYYTKVLRFDFFDKRMSEDSHIDIAFVGMDDSIADITALCEKASSITLYSGDVTYPVDPDTGEIIDNTIKVPSVLVDPSSGYTHSTAEYGSQIDKINGVSISIQGGSRAGITTYAFEGMTIADSTVTDRANVSGYYLAVAGWCVTEGGIDKYVWSADGGKTWHTAENYGRSPGTASKDMIDAAYARSNKTYEFTSSDAANGTFQGANGANPTGLGINLEAYKGQKVHIIFGAVPASDTSTIIPMFYIANVPVAE